MRKVKCNVLGFPERNEVIEFCTIHDSFIQASCHNSPARFVQNAGRVDTGEAVALGLIYSWKPVWGQRAEGHSGELKEFSVGAWFAGRSLTASWPEVARQPEAVGTSLPICSHLPAD